MYESTELSYTPARTFEGYVRNPSQFFEGFLVICQLAWNVEIQLINAILKD